jgi:hypothetical protein
MASADRQSWARVPPHLAWKHPVCHRFGARPPPCFPTALPPMPSRTAPRPRQWAISSEAWCSHRWARRSGVAWRLLRGEPQPPMFRPAVLVDFSRRTPRRCSCTGGTPDPNILPDVGAGGEDQAFTQAPAVEHWRGGSAGAPVSEPVTEGRTTVDYRRQHPAAQVPHPQHLRGRDWSGVSPFQELKIRVSGVRFPLWPSGKINSVSISGIEFCGFQTRCRFVLPRAVSARRSRRGAGFAGDAHLHAGGRE